MPGEGPLFIGVRGTVLALDPATGQVLWNDTLEGLGLGLVTIAGSSRPTPAAEEARRRQARAAASAAAASSR